MKVMKNQVFNLMDTNGRREDVINALSGYIEILNDITENKGLKWGSMPESFAQFEFYRQALLKFPETFKVHSYYDKFLEEIGKNKKVKEAVQRLDTEPFRNNSRGFEEISGLFDKGIEDRARHYTSTLNKLGFTDKERNITEVGKQLLNPKAVEKDELEELLSIDSVNVIYLRQLMKLRIFDESGNKFIAPFCLALYLLLENDRISEEDFFEVIQNATPYISEMPKKSEMPDEYTFLNLLKNRKSEKTTDIYLQFYGLLSDFYIKQNKTELGYLLSYYEKNKAILNKAFGKGRSFLKYDKQGSGEKNPAVFLRDNGDLFSDNMSQKLYKMFSESKRYDAIREYSDTTKRIFKATGIISFKKGCVELVNKELLECITDIEKLKQIMTGYIYEEQDVLYECYEDYEGDRYSYFCMNHSLCDILGYTEEDVKTIVLKIKKRFAVKDGESIKEKLYKKRSMEFESFIALKYPVREVQRILSLFSDRTNDKLIKKTVSPDASVPTIYEYMVGIAWYYFSNKTIDLADSLNLTMSADFEPLVHAGGGQGDIIIREKHRIIMLEATLMNASSQKRGEWEPVLRHSVNLKAEVENNPADSQKDVITFFIADEFDVNTINIWKAVSSVPLQSSADKELFTENVMIMPVSNAELSVLTEKNTEYEKILETIKELFEKDKQQFDMGWRDKYMKMLHLQ